MFFSVVCSPLCPPCPQSTLIQILSFSSASFGGIQMAPFVVNNFSLFSTIFEQSCASLGFCWDKYIYHLFGNRMPDSMYNLIGTIKRADRNGFSGLFGPPHLERRSAHELSSSGIWTTWYLNIDDSVVHRWIFESTCLVMDSLTWYGLKINVKFLRSVYIINPSGRIKKWSNLLHDAIMEKASFSAVDQLNEAPVKGPDKKEMGSCLCSIFGRYLSVTGIWVNTDDQCYCEAYVNRQSILFGSGMESAQAFFSAFLAALRQCIWVSLNSISNGVIFEAFRFVLPFSFL